MMETWSSLSLNIEPIGHNEEQCSEEKVEAR